MSKSIMTAAAAITVFTLPVFADDARTPPPSQPYYATDAQACDDIGLTIYFQPGNAELTAHSRDVIREARQQLNGCSVTSINGTAIANDAEGAADKLTLADARRSAVVTALDAHGIRSARTELQTDVSAAASDTVMARKVGLTIQASPAQIGS